MIRKASHVTRVGKRNQVTIPAAMLRALGVAPGDRVEVSGDDGVLSLRKAEDPFERLRRLRVRAGVPELSDEEIALAITEARLERARRAADRDAQVVQELNERAR